MLHTIDDRLMLRYEMTCCVAQSLKYNQYTAYGLLRRINREVNGMATKSITKNIVIRNRRAALALVRALEKSKTSDKKKPVAKAVLYNPSVEQVRKLFGIE